MDLLPKILKELKIYLGKNQFILFKKILDTIFAAELLNEGFSFVACAVDSDLLAKASDNALNNVKENLS